MGIDQEKIKPFGLPLVGFTGEQVLPIGLISLPITAGTIPQRTTVIVNFFFFFIDRPSAYNVIIGCTSTYHLKMKFPTEEGVEEVKGDQVAARKCYVTSLKKAPDSTTLTIGIVDEAKG